MTSTFFHLNVKFAVRVLRLLEQVPKLIHEVEKDFSLEEFLLCRDVVVL
jgi:hypothetical protein